MSLIRQVTGVAVLNGSTRDTPQLLDYQHQLVAMVCQQLLKVYFPAYIKVFSFVTLSQSCQSYFAIENKACKIPTLKFKLNI